MSTATRLISALARSRASLPARVALRRLRETYYNAEVLGRIERKTKPLDLDIRRDEPRRINLLIPEIDFASFFGGYIAKFNLAKRLAARGHRVRVVMIDQCDENPQNWDRCIGQYEGLEGFRENVEIAPHFDRGRKLAVHTDDAIIATTWWSAYVADAMREALGRERFVYLIQEYEPFTFAMGSWYAMAHASYAFPHDALFSSTLLEQFFKQNGYGVFAVDRAGDVDSSSVAFENAIVRYNEDDMRSVRDRARPPWKLLFYARPEPHATRNMFEIGYLALREAISTGEFPAGKWDIHGIGTRHGDIDLGAGQRLKMLGKFGLAEYRAALLGYDVGLGLMYTPHPSLLPLEMAAAGMQVVSSACMNKDAAELAKISPNLIAADATIAGVSAALSRAAKRSTDLGARTDRNRINWSNSWDDTFDENLLERIESWIA